MEREKSFAQKYTYSNRSFFPYSAGNKNLEDASEDEFEAIYIPRQSKFAVTVACYCASTVTTL